MSANKVDFKTKRTYINNKNNKLDSTSIPLLLKFAIQMFRPYVDGMARYILKHGNDHWCQDCIQAKWKIITHLQLFQEILSSCQNNRTAGWGGGQGLFKLALRPKKFMQSHSHGCLEEPTLSLCWAGVQQQHWRSSLLATSAQQMGYSSSFHYIWAVGEHRVPLEPQISKTNATLKAGLLGCGRIVNHNATLLVLTQGRNETGVYCKPHDCANRVDVEKAKP